MIERSARWWRELGVEVEGLLAPVMPVAPSALLPQQAGRTSGRTAPVPQPAGRTGGRTAAVPPQPGGTGGRTAPAAAPPAARRPVAELPAGRAAGTGSAAVVQGPSARLAPSDLQPLPPPDPLRLQAIGALGWQELPAAIEACTACTLHAGRQCSLPGTGAAGAPWLFLSDGPDGEDDLRGTALSGEAGILFDNMLAALGIARGEQVFLGTVLKCRLPDNRTPTPAQVAACLPFLERQISLLQPAVIVALGKTAAQALLGSSFNVRSLRGKVHWHGRTPVVVTFHPMFLLENPGDKGGVWADLCLARRLVEQGAPPPVQA